MGIYIVFFIALAVALGITWLHIQTGRKAIKIREREDLDCDTLYSRYYADSGIPQEYMLELWYEVADALKVPPGLLRPDDKFGIDIGVWTFTSEDLDYLGELAIKRARIVGVSIDLQIIKTVDDYVRMLSKVD